MSTKQQLGTHLICAKQMDVEGLGGVLPPTLQRPARTIAQRWLWAWWWQCVGKKEAMLVLGKHGIWATSGGLSPKMAASNSLWPPDSDPHPQNLLNQFSAPLSKGRVDILNPLSFLGSRQTKAKLRSLGGVGGRILAVKMRDSMI